MKSQNTKSSDELQNEVRSELRNVRRDIDQMQGRLTPGQLIDDAIFYRKGSSTAATFDHLKNNPIGTAFLSLGTLMLMEDEDHVTVEAYSKAKASQIAGKAQELKTRAGEMKDQIKSHLPHKELTPGMAPSTGDIAKSKINEVTDTFQSKVSEIKEGLEAKIPSKEEFQTMTSDIGGDISTKTSGKFADAKEKLNSSLQAGKEKLQSSFSGAKDTVHNMDSLTFMALGAGLGALTGAALPVSEAENRFVDEKLQGKVSGFSQDLQNAVNECSNILKDLVINDVKNYNVSLFK